MACARRRPERDGGADVDLRRWLTGGVDAIGEWQATFWPFERHPSLRVSDEQFASAFSTFTERLRENYPFFHPSYAGQMLKPPHPAAVVGYPTAIPVDPNNHALAGGRIGTVVATAGTTGLGAIDAVHEVLAIARSRGVRVHVDAAYGGFFPLLAGLDDPAGLDEAPWRAIAECDSVVVDPHKHGLQPYGCGAVLFRDPDVGRFYLHDSPYTYFTSDELHLGEISLEYSRAGAAAAALRLTFRLLPPRPDGLGQVLAACRRAALHWAQLISDSDRLELYQRPELDIVSYFPAAGAQSLSAIDQASALLLVVGN